MFWYYFCLLPQHFHLEDSDIQQLSVNHAHKHSGAIWEKESLKRSCILFCIMRFPRTADCCIAYGPPQRYPFYLPSGIRLNPSVTKTRVEDRFSNESHSGPRGALPRPNQQGLSGWYTPTSTSTTLSPSHAATCSR